MNSYSSARKTYGVLSLTPATLNGLRRDFAVIEAPVAHWRRLRLVATAEAQAVAPARPWSRRMARDLAA